MTQKQPVAYFECKEKHRFGLLYSDAEVDKYLGKLSQRISYPDCPQCHTRATKLTMPNLLSDVFHN